MGQIVGKIEGDSFLRKYLAAAPASTVSVMTSLYNNHFLPAIRETEEFEELIAIWSNTISRFGKPLGSRTVSKLVSIYREWYYVKHRHLPNTARIMRRVTRNASRKVVDHWTPQQTSALLDAAYGYDQEIYDRILFALHTGVRKEDWTALRKADCLFATNTVAITSDPDFNVTKSAQPRPVKMTQDVRAMLLRRTEGLADDDLVFGPSEYLDRLRRVCEYASIPLSHRC